MYNIATYSRCFGADDPDNRVKLDEISRVANSSRQNGSKQARRASGHHNDRSRRSSQYKVEHSTPPTVEETAREASASHSHELKSETCTCSDWSITQFASSLSVTTHPEIT